jgi:hypothetical protein
MEGGRERAKEREGWMDGGRERASKNKRGMYIEGEGER